MPSRDTKKIKSVHKNTKFSFIVILLAVIASVLIILFNKSTDDNPYLLVNGQKIYIETLTTEKQKEKGLSGRKFLASNNGLLFVYENMGNWKIWMKNMFFPIDVIWIDNEGIVVGVKTNISPESYPEIHQIDRQSRYIIELNAGAAERYNIKPGDKIYNLPQ